MIFDEKIYHKFGQPYLDVFYELDDDDIIPSFSIKTINFRFEHNNLTGKQVKDKLHDYLF